MSASILRTRLGNVPPLELHAARRVLHHAVQPLAAFGGTVAEPDPTDRHRSMTWDPQAGMFTTWAPHRGTGGRLALEAGALTLRHTNQEGKGISEFSLPGRTLDEAYAWVADQLSLKDGEVVRPEFEIPAHGVGGGEPFPPPDPALREVLAWFDHAHAHLTDMVAPLPGAGDPICWPHHFDLAVLYEPWGPREGRSVGVGLSPGDERIPEPYWYVSPWPYPTLEDLGPLPAGAWTDDGWVGAVLKGTEMVLWGEAPQGDRNVGGFLRTAIETTTAVLSRRTRTPRASS